MVIRRVSEILSNNHSNNNKVQTNTRELEEGSRDEGSGGGGGGGEGESHGAPKEDCLQCRLVGGTGLTSLGVWLLLPHKPFVGPTSQGRMQSMATKLLGLTFIGLGCVRFLGLSLPLTPDVSNNDLIGDRQPHKLTPNHRVTTN